MSRPVGTKKQNFAYLDETQLRRFFQAVKKARNIQHELWFDLCLYFGLRVSELTYIKLSDIRSDIYGIEIQGLKNGLKMLYRRIDPRLWRKLMRWLKERKKLRYAKDNIYLFPSSVLYSEPVNVQTIKTAFKKYCKIAGLDDGYSVHSLRHSCGMLKAKAGHHPIDIKDWLRQKSLDSTLQYLRMIRFEEQSTEATRVFGSYL